MNSGDESHKAPSREGEKQAPHLSAYNEVGQLEDAPFGTQLAFHIPIIVVLGIWVIPTLHAILLVGIAGDSLPGYDKLTWVDLLMTGFASIIPTIFAFATTLKLSMKRFFIGVAISMVFYSVMAGKLVQRAGGIYDPVPSMDALLAALPGAIGGALFWLLPAWGIGLAGVWVSSKLRALVSWGPEIGFILMLVLAGLPYSDMLHTESGVPIESVLELGDDIGYSPTRVHGEGNVTWVERYGFREKKSTQVAEVSLDDGRSVALIEYFSAGIQYGFKLSDIQVGQRVRFEGWYHTSRRHMQKVQLGMVKRAMASGPASPRSMEDGVLVQGYGPRDEYGEIEVVN